AQAETLYTTCCRLLRVQLDSGSRAHREIIDELNEKLAEKLFVNFSLFQSLPDVWGIDQIFPVMPINGLNRPLSRRAVIQDITCDSDGR
ncbi:arginine decarboxylase, partial [Pantoea sp. SIMBA_133]